MPKNPTKQPPIGGKGKKAPKPKTPATAEKPKKEKRTKKAAEEPKAPETPAAVDDATSGTPGEQPLEPSSTPAAGFDKRFIRMKCPIPLSTEERLALADKRMRLDGRVKAIKLGRTQATQKFNHELAAVEKEIEETVSTWNRGNREEEREVEVQIDYVGGKKMFIHPVSGEIFKTEALGPGERQRLLGEDTHGEPLAKVATFPGPRAVPAAKDSGMTLRFNLETKLVLPTAAEIDSIKKTEVGQRLRLRGQLFEKVEQRAWILVEQTGRLKEAIGEQLEQAIAKARAGATSELEAAGFTVTTQEPKTFPATACLDCGEKETNEAPLYDFEPNGPRRCAHCFDAERERRSAVQDAPPAAEVGLPIIDKRDGREIGRAIIDGPMIEGRFNDDAPSDPVSMLVNAGDHVDYVTDPAEIAGAITTGSSEGMVEEAGATPARILPAGDGTHCGACGVELKTKLEREFKKCKGCSDAETMALRQANGTLPAQHVETCGKCDRELHAGELSAPELDTVLFGRVCRSCNSAMLEAAARQDDAGLEPETETGAPAEAITCSDCGNLMAADDINVRPGQEGVFCAGCANFYCGSCGVRLSAPAKSCLDCYNAAAAAHPPAVMA